MTVRQLFVQAQEYNARDDRAMLAALLPWGMAAVPWGTAFGLRSLSDLRLTMTGATTGTIGPGAVYIPWGGSLYIVTVDPSEPVTFTPAHATQARIDTVIARVYDSEAGGPDQPPTISVLTGTPATNPTRPALPDGSVALYDVRYNAASNAPILLDRRGTLTGDYPSRPLHPVQRARVNQAITTNAQGRFRVAFEDGYPAGSLGWVAVFAIAGDASATGVRQVGIERESIDQFGFNGWLRNHAGTVLGNTIAHILYFSTDT